MKPAFYRTGLIIALFLTVTTSFAQYKSGQLGAGVYANGIKLVGGTTDASTVNFASGISLRYTFSEILTGEITAGLGWVRPRDPDSHFKVRTGTPYRTYIYPWSLNIRYHPLPEKKLIPFVGLGAGLTHWNLRDISGEDTWLPIPESGTSIYGMQTNFTLLGTAGATVYLLEKLSLDLVIRYSHLLGQNKDNIGTGDVNNGLIEVRFGLGYDLGFLKTADFDGDGIEDKFDGNPYQPEDFDGFKDDDGIPDLDNDNDGIPDVLDKCPNEPEDIDGFQDEDGCPDSDNDNDGIPDVLDKCPNEPEDIDGFQDEDGCPDPDNDNDGIPDVLDNCPNDPETFNEYKDEDGCPDEKAGIMPLEKGKKLVLEGVIFPSGKAVLTYETKEVLEKVYKILRNNPEIRVEIRGFTDSIGSASANLTISQKRADVVKGYLVEKGISFNRLRAIGYGEAEPIASNKTKEGRAKNRRIELIRIED